MNQPATIDMAISERTTIQVSPYCLKDAKWGNVRTSRDPESFVNLKTSMRARGRLIQPVVARKVDYLNEGEYELLAGYGRRDGSIDLKWPLIDVSIVECDDAEALAIMLDENEQRENMNAADEAESAALAVQVNGGDYKLAAKQLGWSETMVRQRITLNNCSDKVKVAIRERLIDVGHASVLSQFPSDKQDAILTKVVQEKWTVAQLNEHCRKQSIPLNKALFDLADCEQCPHNSSVQSDLFASTGVQGGKCGNSKCFGGKQATELLKKKEALAEEYESVFLLHEKPANLRKTTSEEIMGADQFATCRTCANNSAIIDDRILTAGVVIENQCTNLSCFESALPKKADMIATDNVIKQAGTAKGKSKPDSAKSPAKTAPKKATLSKGILTAYAGHHRTAARQAISANIKSDRLIRAMAINAVADTYCVDSNQKEVKAFLTANGYDESVISALSSSPDRIGKLVALDLTTLNKLQVVIVLAATEFGRGRHDSTAEPATQSLYKMLKTYVVSEYTDIYKSNLIANWQPTKESLGLYTKAALSVLLDQPSQAGESFKANYIKQFDESTYSKLSKGKVSEYIDGVLSNESYDWSSYAPLSLLIEAGIPA
ncbi:ParB/RepB/Spo0J family partition protein [Reinekea sp. G2M2-21]|uniref:ParB/RepB/Spo0J family partition protein n=1 Tax=Reinekea sp. G2M2-21 TaxID=2788942 RepID=UPI0018AB928A|nr:ParB/RepB/Spo0J family partition protein [Reinekea sp. G2M2-21]